MNSGNALFLSGNTAFWQVRLTDDGTGMIGFKDRFERDPVFGYELMKRFAPVLIQRLDATRLQLLDLYGNDV